MSQANQAIAPLSSSLCFRSLDSRALIAWPGRASGGHFTVSINVPFCNRLPCLVVLREAIRVASEFLCRFILSAAPSFNLNFAETVSDYLHVIWSLAATRSVNNDRLLLLKNENFSCSIYIYIIHFCRSKKCNEQQPDLRVLLLSHFVASGNDR